MDATGLTNAANIADRVAAHIAAVMPHSPAEEGPLKKPITFDYIAANLESAAGRLKRSANASALQLAQAFAPNGMAGGLLNAGLHDAYAAQRMTAAQAVQTTGQPQPTNVTTVNQYALHADEYAKLLADAQRGANAEHWIRTAHA